jgi:acyl dehydratase
MDYEKLRQWVFPEIERAYTERDTMLYALGLGLGGQPTDEFELRFVTETRLETLPTMAAVVGRNPPWLAQVGIKVTDAVHGEQRMLFHRLLPREGTVRVRSRLGGVVDKGAGRGALIHVKQEIIDAASGAVACTATQTSFIRGSGGFGGPAGPSPTPHPMPPRAQDVVDEFPTPSQIALLYRLSGDRNPLHSEPEIARAAGFARPILHGLATYGIVGWRIVRALGDGNPRRLAALDTRFSAAVLPGETLRTELWRDGETVSFQTWAAERNVLVLTNGRAVLRD